MADEGEELIKEIAMKHGIAISRDDPIFVLQTINQRLMQDSARAQQAMLDEYKAELAVIAQAWSSDAKSMAERVLNAAMTASKETMIRLIDQGAKAASALMRAEVDAALGNLAGTLRNSRRLAMVNLVASALTLMAGSLALWAMLIH